MKQRFSLVLILVVFSFIACQTKSSKKKRVLAIPVYGQSLALGEEAIRITDFDTLTSETNHMVVTENLDENFGYHSDTHLKQWLKKMMNARERSFELSVYGMAELTSKYLLKKGMGDSVLIATFPGGKGATGINEMSKGSKAYKKFLEEIKGAYKKASNIGWDFVMPAFCWMQGEDDIVWGKSSNYKKDLKRFQADLNKDIKAITKQREDVVCILYQTNCLTLADDFNATSYNCKETAIPQAQLDLISEDKMFTASGPTYPYSFVNERVHIDGISQKRIGYMAGLSLIRLLESKPSNGLIPKKFTVSGDTILIKFDVPTPPLVLDTTNVKYADHFGFSVIDPSNNNILEKVLLKNDVVKLCCKKSPLGAKARYAVNGTKNKSGFKHGPRGNLRDSQGKKISLPINKMIYPLHNWCYQFDVLMN
ncbi:sialate O-acetylesterase [Pedobacter gandavensis]|uniref:sialate O-acetylesterase n=1 Tax=Pedobacter gandavensis TaxID=2679963 RepID=UPI0029301CEB|nr:sialate O-acetylesterase [Pedobacter gandavensis]